MRPADARTAEPSGAATRTPILNMALELVRAGRIRQALAALDPLIAGRARVGCELSPEDAAVALTLAVECRLARGDLAEAMALGDALTPYLDGTGLPAGAAHHAKAELASVLGDPELAVVHHLAARERLADPAVAATMSPELVDALPWRGAAALALVRVGQGRAALEVAEAWQAVAAASGSAYARAHALRTLAGVDIGTQRVSRLRQARTALDQVTAERLAAQVDADLAGLLMLDPGHDPDEVVALLRHAEEYAGGQELWPLQGRVRRLLDRLGQEPHQVPREALASLTESQQRVARRAASGLSNRQIAEELAVTVKAVEWHLSHVYRKLGIGSRRRLAAAVGPTAG